MPPPVVRALLPAPPVVSVPVFPVPVPVVPVRVLVAVGCVPPVTSARVPVTADDVAVVSWAAVLVAVWAAVLVTDDSVLVGAAWLTGPGCDPAAEPSTASVMPLPTGGAAAGNGAWSAPDPALVGPALGEVVAVALGEAAVAVALAADVVAVAVWATAEPNDSGLVPVVPGRAGICAAAAGWARIRARIKAAAMPPQVYRHTRRTSSPTLDSPTLEEDGDIPLHGAVA
jgi:hypothetical protein